MNKQDLVKLANMKMPFGRFAGSVLIDVPEEYFLWFEKDSFPNGELGRLMALCLEVKRAGLAPIIQPLKNSQNSSGEKICMSPDQLIYLLKSTPEAASFHQVINTIDKFYTYTPCQFSNGLGDDCMLNAAGENVRSSKIFAFAQLNHLSASQTLACFGSYYRTQVLGAPKGTNHSNIRRFQRDGWAGIKFNSMPLKLKGRQLNY